MNDGKPDGNDARRLAMPDISRYRAGNTGIPFVHRLEGPAAGPEVLVTALVHGNEVCGAHALDHLLGRGPQPRRGTVTAVFCNPEAALTTAGGRPGPSRYLDDDLNRLWSPGVLEGGRDSAELRRARRLRPLVEHAELLLDLHSMQSSHTPVMLAGPLAKGRRLAGKVGVPEVVISDAGHAAGVRLRDFGGFADPESAKNALLVECGQHLDPASAAFAVEVLYRFLVVAGVLDAADVAPFVSMRRPGRQRFLQVTEAVAVETGEFRFARPFQSLETIAQPGTLLAHDGVKEVRTPYPDCVLVMPSRRPARGSTAVRLAHALRPDADPPG